jgi:hypothetical protein
LDFGFHLQIMAAAAAKGPTMATETKAPQCLPREKNEILAELKRRGLGDESAAQAIELHDPTSLRVILDFHRRKEQAGDLRKPLAALIDMIFNHFKWQFRRGPNGGLMPPKER